MNILFLSISHKDSIENRGIYTDLLRQFRDNGHCVYMVSPYEKRIGKQTEYRQEHDVHNLHVRTGNITKCGKIEKGISMLRIEQQYLNAIKKNFPGVHFDLVLYPTPPITLVGVVQYIKKRDHAKTYLMLKDIFPQNAVDIGLMKKRGVKGILYRYFRRKEKKLYAISDYIGCMSQANVDYILKHNPEIVREKVHICPNSVEPRELALSAEERNDIRRKYDIPLDKKVFVYGGNLGKPQGIPFIIDCLRSQKEKKDVFFFIVGDGTEYEKIKAFMDSEAPTNARLLKRLPKEDYERLVSACDVGLLFLDHRFTIPNFPSRLLSYMQSGLPVLACTDPNTDVGKVITEGDFGWWCESNDIPAFDRLVDAAAEADIMRYAENAKRYLEEQYHVKKTYQTIMEAVTETK